VNTKEKFKTIPGVGEKIAQVLTDLGCRKLNDLQGQDPEKMYENLMVLRKQPIDRCVLYVFRCPVYFVSNTVYDPALLNWWAWKNKK